MREPVFYVPHDEAVALGRQMFATGFCLGCAGSFIIWAILHVFL